MIIYLQDIVSGVGFRSRVQGVLDVFPSKSGRALKITSSYYTVSGGPRGRLTIATSDVIRKEQVISGAIVE